MPEALEAISKVLESKLSQDLKRLFGWFTYEEASVSDKIITVSSTLGSGAQRKYLKRASTLENPVSRARKVSTTEPEGFFSE